ncbi:ChbG/HpnK family deacetylase [Edaphobacter sp.]|uniref:ChbG/HpnK family deacetylase n=1 Tax=Edaphobacter sp. TaxID=1934404 RepID=UPI002DBCD27A|nr:ChbG/HpnK family deacetylase [Edaphobacter sp.]HEU5339742.1 ChbG/HpnK family deacetylase [Edaphobacter sp.]
MAPRLIINADDFGLTPGVNRAIAELHQAGALTSATLMATGPAFDDAVAIAIANPALGVGCHVILTDGQPVSPPETIPTLLGRDRASFRPSLFDFAQALLRGNVHEDEIEREALAQINKLQAAGIRITHLDTHKHTHLFPAVTRPLLRAAERAGIRAVRNPFEQHWSASLDHGSALRRLQVRLLRRFHTSFDRQPQISSARILTTNGTIGISATGNLDQTTLHTILRSIPPATATFELCCHPGYNDSDLDRITTRLRTHRDIERTALLAEIPALTLHPNAPRLIHYGELAQTTGDVDRLLTYHP